MSEIALPTGAAVPSGKKWEVIDGDHLCAEALAAGVAVYLNSSGLWALADNDAAATAGGIVGVNMTTTTAANEPCDVMIFGEVNGFASLTIGNRYAVGDTAGRLYPSADVVDADYIVWVGMAVSATAILVVPSVPQSLQDTYVPIPDSAAQGDILYRNATVWARLAAGADEQVLTTQGAGQNPTWLEAITSANPASQADGDLFASDGTNFQRIATTTAGKSLVALGAGNLPGYRNKPFSVVVPITTATGQTGLNAWGMVIPTGYSLRVDAVSVFASGVTAVISVDVKEGDTTILSAPITPVADTVTAGTVSDASVAAAAELNVTYTTDGAGAGVNLKVTIVGELIQA